MVTWISTATNIYLFKRSLKIANLKGRHKWKMCCTVCGLLKQQQSSSWYKSGHNFNLSAWAESLRQMEKRERILLKLPKVLMGSGSGYQHEIWFWPKLSSELKETTLPAFYLSMIKEASCTINPTLNYDFSIFVLLPKSFYVGCLNPRTMVKIKEQESFLVLFQYLLKLIIQCHMWWCSESANMKYL